MPVEPQHAAKRLKPKWIGQSAEHFARAVFLDDVRENFVGEQDHPGKQPRRRLAAMQGKRRVPRPLSERHRSILCDTMGRRLERVINRQRAPALRQAKGAPSGVEGRD